MSLDFNFSGGQGFGSPPNPEKVKNCLLGGSLQQPRKGRWASDFPRHFAGAQPFESSAGWHHPLLEAEGEKPRRAVDRNGGLRSPKKWGPRGGSLGALCLFTCVAHGSGVLFWCFCVQEAHADNIIWTQREGFSEARDMQALREICRIPPPSNPSGKSRKNKYNPFASRHFLYVHLLKNMYFSPGGFERESITEIRLFSTGTNTYMEVKGHVHGDSLPEFLDSRIFGGLDHFSGSKNVLMVWHPLDSEV